MDYSDYSKKDLLALNGSLEQVIAVHRFLYTEGKATGMQGLSFRTLGGLAGGLLPDRGLDIAWLSYKGVNLSFMSKNGLVSPFLAHRGDGGFPKYFTGGMLTSCGLRNAGGACVDDDGEYHPIHGSFSLIPALELSIERPEIYQVKISGTIKETSLFGHNLRMRRSILIDDREASITVNDKLENLAPEDEEIMILYHYNFGFPFLDDGCRIEFQDDLTTRPRDEDARPGLKDFREISGPIDGYKEQVFLHRQGADQDGLAHVKLINDKLGMEARLSYSADTLPDLIQWKNMRSTDYTLGLEPSNCEIMGRKSQRADGSLEIIKAYESKIYKSVLAFS